MHGKLRTRVQLLERLQVPASGVCVPRRDQGSLVVHLVQDALSPVEPEFYEGHKHVVGKSVADSHTDV